MAGENRVQRLCRDHGIWSVFSKKRGLNRKPGPPVHDDLVERDFTAAAPNEPWLTDITEHPNGEDKLCLCAVQDVYSGRIVGYSTDSRMKSSLAVAVCQPVAPKRFEEPSRPELGPAVRMHHCSGRRRAHTAFSRVMKSWAVNLTSCSRGFW